MCNRRKFLKNCATFGTAMLSTKTNLLAFSTQQINENQPILIKIFLRGGCDALNLVAPIEDKNYEDARAKKLKINEKEGLILKNKLNDFEFALHPKAAALSEIYNSNQMAIIHACGLSNGTRSHFDAQNLIEKGTAGKNNINSGWLSRYLQILDNSNAVIPAAHIGQFSPLSLMGNNKVLAINNLAEFSLKGDKKLSGLLKSAYKQENRYLNQIALSTFDNIKKIQQQINPAKLDKIPDYKSSYPYPANDLSEQLKTIAQLLKTETGLSVATVDMGGWDTHEAQERKFNKLVEELSTALAAFYNDVSDFHNRLTIIVLSEFGRRVKSNQSEGTDHGHGGCALVLGGKVNGGQLYGKWEGLATEQLAQRVDLQVSTDYRTILSEISLQAISKDKLINLFPNFEYKKGLGIIKN
jgi:uncharacterized protein (DUF1501 family)